MDTSWQPDLSAAEGPKFRALAAAIREAARSGCLPPGTRLPPVRDLAWQLGVTPGTVARAYQIAAADGVVASHVGRGSFIAHPRPRIGPLQPMLTERVEGSVASGAPADLRIPQLPDCGQTDAIRRAMTRAALKINEKVLDYPPLAHDCDCRAALVDWLSDRDLGPFDERDVVLAHGGQSGILLVMSLCLTGERPRLMCETLCYPGLRHAARLLRAEITPIAQDDQGMLPDALDRAARTTGARLVCITPSVQNPTAARMGTARRQALIDVARHHDLQMIEDECSADPLLSADLRATPSLRQLAPERVWHVTSLSKILSAGLRFGLVICPPGMGGAGRLAAQHSFFGLPLPLTALVTELLTSGEARVLAAAVQQIYADRTELASAIFAGTDFVSQPAVPFLWLRLQPGWPASTFAAQAAERGVLLRPADEFAAINGAAAVPNAVRVSLPGRMDRDRLASALKTLAALYHSPAGDLPV